MVETTELSILNVAVHLNINNLKPSGSVYKCLCPIHAEKTPSFTIFPKTNTFKCFGCGVGRSIVDLVMLMRDCSYGYALKWLDDTFDCGAVVTELPIFNTVKPHKVISDLEINYYSKLLFHSKRDYWFRDRLFTEKTIRTEGFGWDGRRYIIPVWLGEPLVSPCVGLRKRASDLCDSTEDKYIGRKGYNNATIYGRHYTYKAETIIVFAGELDARLAIQDGLAAVSVVGGVNSFRRFIKNWAFLWFPSVTKIIVAFDRKEANYGAKLALDWESQKGRNTAFVYHWVHKDCEDYNDFRLKGDTVKIFLELVGKQIKRLDLSKVLVK